MDEPAFAARRRPSNRATAAATALLLIAHGAMDSTLAAPPSTTQPAATTQPTTTTQPAEPKLPLDSPPYKLLRYDEDYSWLDAPPGTYKTDATDALKNIHLTRDLRLSVGGEIRVRFEYERNRTFLRPEPTSDGYLLHRYFLWTDLRYRDLVRIFVEGEATFEEGVDLNPTAPIFENRWDLKQGFVDLRLLGERTPLVFRAGRQELLYGNQRLISPLPWANVHRRFDALKLFWQGRAWDIDVFWARPVDISRTLGRDKAFDHYDEDIDFLGLYSACKAIPDHRLEAYFLTLLDNDPPLNANGRADHQQIYTIGGRLQGKRADWDYEFESAFQTGQWGPDQVGAWFLATETGYTFSKTPTTPRVWIAFDYASGDANPNDGKHGTFNQLFPLGHAYFGYADLVGRQNIIDPHFGVSVRPLKNLFFSAEQHFFALAEKTDALYNAAGAPTRRDRTGNSGRFVGHEIDLLMRYTLDRHSAIEVGYCHFEGGGWLQSTGPERPVEFFYVQYQLKF